jgi:hypothetical protein
MFKIIIFCSSLIFAILLLSCATGRIESLTRLPNEAIVIAKLKILNFGDDETSNTHLLFNERAWGTYHVKPDDSNYIYMKLPIGKHNLARVSIEDRSINIPDTYTSFVIPEGKIYYIGDISTKLRLRPNLGFMFGLLGALAYESRSLELPEIIVENNINQATSYFKKMFPSSDTIYTSIMNVDTVHFKVTSSQKSDTNNRKQSKFKKKYGY